ncbi:DUF6402 family protein [Xenorhabdus bovienii]|uniref:DUF6402 family protein n=1 Tax=Xenorhabdus bovienii TaxID=40576 RepID=UPI0023B28AC0|nr:DUF6402 family protein [Xenorhabdus bovienii]MDE9429607.1 DUF6402 family protein [Xenorhabdus bovienii]MDE9458375.1 DUF6402 family protein [Xenorhabdus bovienii]MDE9486437.1 DUF6402 family protein [Xenorhabdus bovienii]MDE9514606.1 DUF6402 family protein [Xenorhabdus bovienii]
MAIFSAKTVKGGAVTDINVDIFMLNEIPNSMKKMGWEMAPKIMRYWFERPKIEFTQEEKVRYIKEIDSIDIPKDRVNDSIVKMEWAMNFNQVKEATEELVQKWASPNGIKLLKKRLSVNSNKIGYSDSAIELDTYAQVNYKEIGSLTDTIDDYFGAIGKATLKLAVRGYVDKIKTKNVFITEGLGIYLKDSYDFFNPDEFLGVWSRDGVLSKVKTAVYMGFYNDNMWRELATGEYSKHVPVYNRNFREWQKKHNKGGDFIVFSDVLWISPLPKDRVIYL